MQINVGPGTLYSLFMGETTVSVPSFQRNYSWTKDQIDQFLLDVYESASSNESHFWGPVVFLRLPNEQSKLQVIDGQQRITTSVIMLSILRDAALALTDRIINPNTPAQFDMSSIVRNFLYLPHEYVQPRFSGSYMVEDVLKKYVLADPFDALGNPRPQLSINGAGMTASDRNNSRGLRRAYIQMKNSFTEKIATYPESEQKHFVNRVFVALTNLFEIHSMELSNEDDAYVLFESLNDRGLRLNPSDLLKTLTLREIRNSGGIVTVDQALSIWDQSQENLGEYDFTKFLRHYLLTQTPRKVQQVRIFKHFREQIESLGTQGAEQNLRRINASTEYYANLLAKTEHPDRILQESFERINVYSDTHRVFLLGMLQMHGNLTMESQRMLTRAIEHVSFRWIGAGRNAQELESLYQEQVHILRANPDDETALIIRDNLISKAPTDVDLDNLMWTDSAKLQRYILRRIERSTGGAIAGQPTIEHLAPRTPGNHGDHWYSSVASKDTPDEFDRTYDDYVGCWGNLTLLEHSLNSSIQNAPWNVKVSGDPESQYQGLTASNYNLNSKIVESEAWTIQHILSRSEWLKETTLELTGRLWVISGQAPITMWPGLSN
jgi:hypothetical protein